MIDFIKGTIIDTHVSHFLDSVKFNFTENVNIDTAEVRKTNRARYKIDYFKGMKLKIHDSGRMTIEGSLHKLFNNGLHNFNDFHHSDYQLAIVELCEHFEIEPQNVIITQLEYGVNITPPIRSKTILKNCLFHEKDYFKDGHVKNGTYRQAPKGKKSRLIKTYDKQAQYKKDFDLKEEILRFEVKQRDMYHLRRNHNIISLDDLFNTPFELFNDLLVKAWDKVIFISPYLKNHEDYMILTNHQHWEKIFKTSSYSLSKNQKHLMELNKTEGKNLKEEIKQLLINKAIELSTLNN